MAMRLSEQEIWQTGGKIDKAHKGKGQGENSEYIRDG